MMQTARAHTHRDVTWIVYNTHMMATDTLLHQYTLRSTQLSDYHTTWTHAWHSSLVHSRRWPEQCKGQG